MIARIDRTTRAAASAVACLAVLLILLAAGLTAVDIFMRSILSSPLFGTNDIVILLLTVAVVACFPYALSIRQHIQVSLVGRALGARGYWALDLFANLVTLAVFAGFTFEFAERAGRLGAMHSGTQLLQIPLEPVWWVAAALLAFGTVAQGIATFGSAIALARGDAMPPETLDGPE